MRHEPANVECILIADLAGACDTGVQFARCGLPCRVELNRSKCRAGPMPDVLAFNTNSCGDSPAHCRRKIEDLAIACSRLGANAQKGISREKVVLMNSASQDAVKDFSAHVQDGKEFFIADCESQHDLHVAVAVGTASSPRILWVGSAALEIALAEHMAKTGLRRSGTLSCWWPAIWRASCFTPPVGTSTLKT